MKINLLIFLLLTYSLVKSQTVNVSIDANAERKAISPLIYGMNNALKDNSTSPLSEAQWQKLRDAGVKMVRELGGNNGTKYNWRLKLSSHPDWYNNVYAHNWDYAAQSLQDNLPAVRGMWCFQLIGKAASTNNYNFNDWAYNNSQWWSGVSQNLAGGGVVNGASGNPDLYLMNWNADSTSTILNYWFNSLALNKTQFQYWSMDNEPEIWSGTHDDVMPVQPEPDVFMQKYFEVAKKVRSIYPSIKLLGPVTCNEWQWYTWKNTSINYKGTNYCWLEYFIKRIAEEQTASGVRLLDVLDIHFYPDSKVADDILQMHRVFFDDTYIFPGANGIKAMNGGWDNSLTKEYIFKRCNAWLTKYLGSNHGVSLSLSEMDINTSNSNLIANWYASMLGTFSKNGVEIFTPWSWKTGMWEVLNLFSNYSKPISVKTVSGNEELLSAYASANSTNDSLTVILVNRSQSSNIQVNIQLSNFSPANGNYKTLTLSNLPSTETFVSKSNNALISSQTAASNGSLSLSTSPLSIKAIILTTGPLGIFNSGSNEISNRLTIKYCQNGNLKGEYKLNKASRLQINLIDINGKTIEIISDSQKDSGICQFDIVKGQLPHGLYIILIKENGKFVESKTIKL